MKIVLETKAGKKHALKTSYFDELLPSYMFAGVFSLLIFGGLALLVREYFATQHSVYEYGSLPILIALLAFALIFLVYGVFCAWSWYDLTRQMSRLDNLVFSMKTGTISTRKTTHKLEGAKFSYELGVVGIPHVGRSYGKGELDAAYLTVRHSRGKLVIPFKSGEFIDIKDKFEQVLEVKISKRA